MIDVQPIVEKTPKDEVASIRKRNFRIEAEGEVPQEVVDHVQRNLVIATNLSSICVDGGYQPNEAMGELARAGADLGISMGLMKMGLPPEEAFLTVYNYRVDNNQKYGWHSDTHVDPVEDGRKHHGSGPIVGCGHCNAAHEYAERYGISPESIEELLAIVKNYQADYPQHMRYINLERDHAEQGILVVQSEEISVLPWDLENQSQFFVYDATRDEVLLKQIAERACERLKVKNPDTTSELAFDELKKIVKEQTNATLGLLQSSKGKPMYSVTYEQDKVAIDLIGYAPTE